ncbi:hypothetical protein NDU88_001711 [Pleurodeles waltl]|uniref:Uncharacterized protein n=1 Tax=Pleurodeles waltl TaxID=8319 RepID=A0AAV7PBZ8_PLEWA|nr:hypothetical protein NDU88_001711 [Pleurodeles waltl]
MRWTVAGSDSTGEWHLDCGAEQAESVRPVVKVRVSTSERPGERRLDWTATHLRRADRGEREVSGMWTGAGSGRWCFWSHTHTESGPGPVRRASAALIGPWPVRRQTAGNLLGL